MTATSRPEIVNLNPDKTLKVGQRNSSYIIIADFEQTSKNGKTENITRNDSIQLVVGANKFDKCESPRNTILPVASSAGILINEAISPSYVINPDRVEQGVDLNYPITGGLDQKVINDSQKGLGTVTLFGDEIQVISYINGVNIHTSPKILTRKRNEEGEPETPTTNAGAGVSLIHGNATEQLQPMVKGQDLHNKITEIIQVISDINKSVLDLGNYILILQNVLAFHTHITPQIPAGVTITAPSIEAIISSVATTPPAVKGQIDNIITQINAIITKINGSSAFKGNFLSDHHKLN